ncbi:MAG: organic solvent transporter substrate-binding protein [Francisellaceae bacterium]|nr:organic solvent transporter substrate-binding protein [Francisellaceae bacterium]
MKIRTLEISVGLFVLLAIGSLLMLALQVSGLNFAKKTEGYTLKAEFSNIGGLKVRSKVAIAGVTIGRVTQIDLDPVSFNASVVMSIDKKENHIPEDSRAAILTAGLLGDNYIGLFPGFDNDAFLKDGSNIPLENTDSAIVLEQLISKFVSGQASSKKSK